jgi:hypothetical protein
MTVKSGHDNVYDNGQDSRTGKFGKVGLTDKPGQVSQGRLKGWMLGHHNNSEDRRARIGNRGPDGQNMLARTGQLG